MDTLGFLLGFFCFFFFFSLPLPALSPALPPAWLDPPAAADVDARDWLVPDVDGVDGGHGAGVASAGFAETTDDTLGEGEGIGQIFL